MALPVDRRRRGGHCRPDPHADAGPLSHRHGRIGGLSRIESHRPILRPGARRCGA